MATRWRAMNGLVVALGLGGMAASIAPRDCPAQEVPGPQSPPAVHPLDRAVGATLKDGWPTVVVITSTSSPESETVIAVLAAGAPGQGAEPGGTDRVVRPGGECLADAPDGRDVGPDDPGLRQGSEGAGAGRRQLREPKDTESALAWLEALGAVPASSADADTAVVRTGHQHNASPQASPQAPPPVIYQAPPPPQPAPPPQAAPPTVLAPVTSAPPQVPVVVSAPSTPVVFQPQASTIVVGPQPPPNIVFASAPPSAPNITMMAPE